MRRTSLLFFVSLLLGCAAHAEQSQQFGDYTVHYNALTTDQLSPEVAKAYGIVRSGSRAMLNIAVLKEQEMGVPKAVMANVSVSAENLAAQRREVRMREIKEQEAVYYIGIVTVSDGETLSFEVNVQPDAEQETHTVTFRQQFFKR